MYKTQFKKNTLLTGFVIQRHKCLHWQHQRSMYVLNIPQMYHCICEDLNMFDSSAVF